jgi:hypothetical protein
MEGCTGPSGTSRCDNHGRTQNRTQTESGFVWAHPKALPQAVAIPCGNDAVTKCRFCNNTSKGYELNPKSKKNSTIEYDQKKLLKMLILSIPKLE